MAPTTPDLAVRIVVDDAAWKAALAQLSDVLQGVRHSFRRAGVGFGGAARRVGRFVQAMTDAYPGAMRDPEHRAAVYQLQDALDDVRLEYLDVTWDIRRECREIEYRVSCHLWASIQPGVTRTDVLERIAQLYLRREAADLDVEVADAAAHELRAGWNWRAKRSGGRLEPLTWSIR